jgi:translation initiation factor IF-1
VAVATATKLSKKISRGPANPGLDVLARGLPICRSGERRRWQQTEPLLGKPMKEEHIEVEGRIQTVLPGTMFRVELDNKHLVLATVCGKMRKRWVRLTAGDRVKMQMSPYDLNKARITWRLK